MLQPGDVIDEKYQIDAVLGRGGMSLVYRATHLQLEQPVALKVLSPAALAVPEYIIRLEREARAASRMRSEHVVRVFDVGVLPSNGAPYLVMEYLEGQDLAALLARRGPLPVDLAVECILHACEALAEAHANGIVHRDLKPANLFLTTGIDGSPCLKVLDFGISRTARGPGIVALTDPGTVLGTPSYMAPEQMESSDAVDPKIDIWALGAILYELLVGKPPYPGEALPQIFMKIMRTRTPRPSDRRSDVPAAIDGVVARCLAIDPRARFASVADLAWALSSAGTARSRDSAARVARVWDRRSAASVTASLPPPVEAPVAGSRRRRSFSGIVAASAGALAVGFFATLAVGTFLHRESRDAVSAAAYDVTHVQGANVDTTLRVSSTEDAVLPSTRSALETSRPHASPRTDGGSGSATPGGPAPRERHDSNEVAPIRIGDAAGGARR